LISSHASARTPIPAPIKSSCRLVGKLSLEILGIKLFPHLETSFSRNHNCGLRVPTRKWTQWMTPNGLEDAISRSTKNLDLLFVAASSILRLRLSKVSFSLVLLRSLSYSSPLSSTSSMDRQSKHRSVGYIVSRSYVSPSFIIPRILINHRESLVCY
jgi:hypothetical protein